MSTSRDGIASPRRGGPYVWVTWLAKMLSGNYECGWAPWFKARYTFEKLERGGFDLAQWKAQHQARVRTEADKYRAAGHEVLVEDAGAFTIRGKTATLAGKPDLIVWPVRDDAPVTVIDCKTGAQKAEDWWQLAIYLFALPRYHERLRGRRLRGVLDYGGDDVVTIEPEEFGPTQEQQIARAMQAIGSEAPPAKAPSPRECRFCEVPVSLCGDRVEQDRAVVETAEF